MKISTKSRYALKVMLDMAEHKDEGFISLKSIAERQNISKNYLEQIMMVFKKENFFHATRGPQGGYKLAKGPHEYTVGQILRVTEGSIAPVSSLEEFDGGAAYMTMPVWAGLEKVIAEYLDGITLQDILDNYGEQAAMNYEI